MHPPYDGLLRRSSIKTVADRSTVPAGPESTQAVCREGNRASRLNRVSAVKPLQAGHSAFSVASHSSMSQRNSGKGKVCVGIALRTGRKSAKFSCQSPVVQVSRIWELAPEPKDGPSAGTPRPSGVLGRHRGTALDVRIASTSCTKRNCSCRFRLIEAFFVIWGHRSSRVKVGHRQRKSYDLPSQDRRAGRVLLSVRTAVAIEDKDCAFYLEIQAVEIYSCFSARAARQGLQRGFLFGTGASNCAISAVWGALPLKVSTPLPKWRPGRRP